MKTPDNHIQLLPEDYVGIKKGENMPMTYEVDNIEAIDQNICETLQCGDIVIKVGENGHKHAYKVAYKSDDEMSLVYTDHENVEEIYYEKGNDGWAKQAKDISPIDKALYTS